MRMCSICGTAVPESLVFFEFTGWRRNRRAGKSGRVEGGPRDFPRAAVYSGRVACRGCVMVAESSGQPSLFDPGVRGGES
jgi:hypothetical protein